MDREGYDQECLRVQSLVEQTVADHQRAFEVGERVGLGLVPVSAVILRLDPLRVGVCYPDDQALAQPLGTEDILQVPVVERLEPTVHAAPLEGRPPIGTLGYLLSSQVEPLIRSTILRPRYARGHASRGASVGEIPL